MVLQLITGLPKGEYDTIATMIQQADPLPSFQKARSQLLLEEMRRSKQEEHSQVALVSNTTTVNTASSAPPLSSDQTHRGGGRMLHAWQG